MFRHTRNGKEIGNQVWEHRDGATEVRASLLVHGPQTDEKGDVVLGADKNPAIVPKHVHIHIIDVEGVYKLSRFSLTDLIEYAAENCKDAEQITITPENVRQIFAGIA